MIRNRKAKTTTQNTLIPSDNWKPLNTKEVLINFEEKWNKLYNSHRHIFILKKINQQNNKNVNNFFQNKEKTKKKNDEIKNTVGNI